MADGNHHVGSDPGALAGDWLYRQGELVLGPVPGRALLEKLYGGEVDGNTPVAPVGTGTFRRIAEIDRLRVHLAKAEAKLRVEAVQRAEDAKRRRKRNIQIGAVAAVALVVAVGAAIGARYLAVHNPFKSEPEGPEITVEPPTIARLSASDEELVDYPGGPSRGRLTDRSGSRVASAERTPKTGRSAHPGTPAEPDGLQTESFDQSAINTVVEAKKKTLYVCFREESQRNQAFAAKIPLEFVVGNDGKVVKLWVDNPSYQKGPLYDCLFRELQKWPFKPYPGERATVGLSFNIGKTS